MHISRYPLATELVDDDHVFIASKTVGPRRYPIKELVDKVESMELGLNALSGNTSSTSGSLSNLTSSLNSLRNSVTNLSTNVGTNTTNINHLTSRVSALETSSSSGSSSGSGTTIGQGSSSSAGIVKLYSSYSLQSDGAYTAKYVNDQLSSFVTPKRIGTTTTTAITALGNSRVPLITAATTGQNDVRNAGRIFCRIIGSLQWNGMYHPFNYTALIGSGGASVAYSSTGWNTGLDLNADRHRFYGFLSNGVVKFELITQIFSYKIYFGLGETGYHYWGGSPFDSSVPASQVNIRLSNNCMIYV